MRQYHITTLLLIALAATAHADTPAAPTTPSAPSTRRQLELAVAQVCANEAGINRRAHADCALIWQATARFSSDDSRLAWLRTHSCRVLGQEYCRRSRPCATGRNCAWSRHLAWSDAQPAEWPTNAVWRPADWSRMRDYVQRLVAGRENGTLPCRGTPITWGGAMDAARASRIGYVALECIGTRNTGYARARER